MFVEIIVEMIWLIGDFLIETAIDATFELLPEWLIKRQR